MTFYDALETRSADEREAALLAALKIQVAKAQGLAGYAGSLEPSGAEDLASLSDLAKLPVLRKSDLVSKQTTGEALGGYNARSVSLAISFNPQGHL